MVLIQKVAFQTSQTWPAFPLTLLPALVSRWPFPLQSCTPIADLTVSLLSFLSFRSLPFKDQLSSPQIINLWLSLIPMHKHLTFDHLTHLCSLSLPLAKSKLLFFGGGNGQFLSTRNLWRTPNPSHCPVFIPPNFSYQELTTYISYLQTQ